MAEDEEFITMFIDEARISVQLNHANVVHIHELGRHADAFFIAGGLSAAFGALSFMDWAEPVRELFPSLPGWVIILLAAFIGGALRVITTTSMGEKQP